MAPPPRGRACRARPPARSISSPSGIPIGISYTPGRSGRRRWTAAAGRGIPGRPCPAYHDAPTAARRAASAGASSLPRLARSLAFSSAAASSFAARPPSTPAPGSARAFALAGRVVAAGMMAGAQASVSTLFTTVGLSRRPLVASSGGRFRGCDRAVLHRLDQRRLLAADVPAGADEHFDAGSPAGARRCPSPHASSRTARLISSRTAVDLLVVLVADVDVARRWRRSSARRGSRPRRPGAACGAASRGP